METYNKSHSSFENIHMSGNNESRDDGDLISSVKNHLNTFEEKKQRSVQKHLLGKRFCHTKPPRIVKYSTEVEETDLSTDSFTGYQTSPSNISVCSVSLKNEPRLNDMGNEKEIELPFRSSSLGFQSDIKGKQAMEKHSEKSRCPETTKNPSYSKLSGICTSAKESNFIQSEEFVLKHNLDAPLHLRKEIDTTQNLEKEFQYLNIKASSKRKKKKAKKKKSTNCELTTKSYSSVQSNETDLAVQGVRNTTLGNSIPFVERTLVIENLPIGISKSSLIDYFCGFGEVQDLILQNVDNTENIAYVVLSPETNTDWIIDCLNESSAFGGSSTTILCRRISCQVK
ncbi:uncharacterized protein LOC106467970 isoform X2 [Limulus polyphemus]|nr:uncharacterized protein LOC106467970 isoform X2 [Limulus polyphemus]